MERVLSNICGARRPGAFTSCFIGPGDNNSIMGEIGERILTGGLRNKPIVIVKYFY